MTDTLLLQNFFKRFPNANRSKFRTLNGKVVYKYYSRSLDVDGNLLKGFMFGDSTIKMDFGEENGVFLLPPQTKSVAEGQQTTINKMNETKTQIHEKEELLKTLQRNYLQHQNPKTLEQINSVKESIFNLRKKLNPELSKINFEPISPSDETKKLFILEQYGFRNIDKIQHNITEGAKESKKRFLDKYPYARVEKFTFDVDLDDKGDVEKYNVYYKIDDTTSYDITSQTFLSNKNWVKDLQYKWITIWGDKGVLQPYTVNTNGISYKVNELKIYATNDLFFEAFLEKFNLKAPDSNNALLDINDLNNNSYLAAIYAAYIATYVCGICTQHFEFNDTTPKIITSMARYHLYYTMKRFLRSPEKMTKYITNDMRTMVQVTHKPTKTLYERKKFASSNANLGAWLNKQPNKNKIHNVRYAYNTHHNIVGVYYDLVVGETPKSLDDYKLFIATESNGLTKTGQLLFQQSVESYVYTILGAQASTRWPIVGRGAMSLQTQSVYLKKVQDTIVQDDQTVLISNMRKAIQDTNVILNTAITPGMILVPSNMIILKEKFLGIITYLTARDLV